MMRTSPFSSFVVCLFLFTFGSSLLIWLSPFVVLVNYLLFKSPFPFCNASFLFSFFSLVTIFLIVLFGFRRFLLFYDFFFVFEFPLLLAFLYLQLSALLFLFVLYRASICDAFVRRIWVIALLHSPF